MANCQRIEKEGNWKHYNAKVLELFYSIYLEPLGFLADNIVSATITTETIIAVTINLRKYCQ